MLGLIGISNAAPIEVSENRQFDPFVKFIDVENLRLFSLQEVSNDFLIKVAKTYLLMLEENSNIDLEMRSKFLDVSKNHFVFQRIFCGIRLF